MRINTIYILSLVSILSFSQFGCSDGSFIGNPAKNAKKVTPTTTTIPDSGSPATTEIPAFETLSFSVTEELNGTALEFISEDPRISLLDSKINFLADLSDIGKKIEGELSIDINDAVSMTDFSVKVIDPIVKVKECRQEIQPIIGAIEPKKKWENRGYTDLTSSKRYYLTYSSPVAGDLDGDGDVEIVSVYSTHTYRHESPIIVLDGKTGAVEWNSMLGNSPITAEASTTPAIVDLDGDGFAEIIAVEVNVEIENVANSGPSGGTIEVERRSYQVNAIDYKTKKLKWQYKHDYTCGVRCMPTVADINGDGEAEIIVGNVVLDKSGNKIFNLSGIDAGDSYKIPSAGDLVKSSPGLEIIQDGKVFSSIGEVLHEVSCSGFTAIGNLDAKGELEHICIQDGKVHVYNSIGTQLWVQDIPVTADATRIGGGGAPNIGDFNGDGKFEIGTAGGYYYVVFDHSGKILWKTPTQDVSSLITGSTIFDFNGDGQVEVVYNDEKKLRIYNGSSGEVLWEAENLSGTLTEYPLVVNIDDSPSVEIVASSPSLGGIVAFYDPSNKWVGSSKVWNQYSYYPGIVDEKLKVLPNPSLADGFRVNSPGSEKLGTQLILPDIAMRAATYFNEGNAGKKIFKIYLENIGEAEGKLSSVEIFQEDRLISKATASHPLAPKTGEVLSIDISNADISLPFEFKINYLDSGNFLFQECDTTNNQGLFTIRDLKDSL